MKVSNGVLQKIMAIIILFICISTQALYANEKRNGGWQLINNNWYYMNENGAMETGWKKLNNIWYYMDKNGTMVTGWKRIDNSWYYMEKNGAMVTGWKRIDNSWYYMEKNGAMVTGWKQIDNSWYYMEKNGAMVTGWKQIDNSWYYMEKNGVMVTGWKKLNNKWYYMNKNGKMLTGWLDDDGIWYYLNANGEMLVNTNIDGWSTDKNGIATLFKYSSVPNNIKVRMLGKSMPYSEPISFNELSYIQLTYYGFDNRTHTGEMVVHKSVAKEIVEIFTELYYKKYPISKITLIDNYNANDNLSMKDNNSSSFCYRLIQGSNNLSKHAKGLAVDINPIQNPYVKKNSISPVEGSAYLDRRNIRKGMIIKDDDCYQAFIKRGWRWGGNWTNPDYQHFEK